MVAGRGVTLPPCLRRRWHLLWSVAQRRSSSLRSTCLHDSQRLRRPTQRSRPHGGTATATRCCPTSFAGRRARTATSRSQPSACAPRDPARRSAGHGCIRALGSRPRAPISGPVTTRPPSTPSPRRRTRRAGRAASRFRGKSTSRVVCAQARRPRQPTRARPKTRRAAFVCSSSPTSRPTTSSSSAHCISSIRYAPYRRPRTKHCVS